MILKVVTAQRIIKGLLAAGVISCLLYVALIDFSLRPNAGVPLHGAAAVIGGLPDLPPQFKQQHMQVVQPFESVIPEKYDEAVVKTRMISEKIKRLTGMVIHSEVIPVSNRTEIGINYNVHIFYYCPVAWWSEEEKGQLDIAFYPELGIYNCSQEVVSDHFKQINKTGIGVILFSWSEVHVPLDLMEKIFTEATKYQLKISFVLEHYPGRVVKEIRKQIELIFDKFARHESFNRIYDKERKRHLPVFYIKNTHHSGIHEVNWRELFGKQSTSLRKTQYDAIFLNHITTKESLASSKRSGFDGFFSYSASNGETYASTWKHWHHISQFADQYKMLFVPSLGPGYAERVFKHHKNHKEKHHAVRHRSNGNYYGVGWRTAIQLQNDPFVSISSFNNWREGTQIEPAVREETFRDYASKSGNYSSSKYLDLTRYWIGEFTDQKTAQESQHFCHAPRNDSQAHNLTSKYSFVKELKQRTRN